MQSLKQGLQAHIDDWKKMLDTLEEDFEGTTDAMNQDIALARALVNNTQPSASKNQANGYHKIFQHQGHEDFLARFQRLFYEQPSDKVWEKMHNAVQFVHRMQFEVDTLRTVVFAKNTLESIEKEPYAVQKYYNIEPLSIDRVSALLSRIEEEREHEKNLWRSMCVGRHARLNHAHWVQQKAIQFEQAPKDSLPWVFNDVSEVLDRLQGERQQLTNSIRHWEKSVGPLERLSPTDLAKSKLETVAVLKRIKASVIHTLDTIKGNVRNWYEAHMLREQSMDSFKREITQAQSVMQHFDKDIKYAKPFNTMYEIHYITASMLRRLCASRMVPGEKDISLETQLFESIIKPCTSYYTGCISQGVKSDLYKNRFFSGTPYKIFNALRQMKKKHGDSLKRMRWWKIAASCMNLCALGIGILMVCGMASLPPVWSLLQAGSWWHPTVWASMLCAGVYAVTTIKALSYMQQKQHWQKSMCKEASAVSVPSCQDDQKESTHCAKESPSSAAATSYAAQSAQSPSSSKGSEKSSEHENQQTSKLNSETAKTLVSINSAFKCSSGDAKCSPSPSQLGVFSEKQHGKDKIPTVVGGASVPS